MRLGLVLEVATSVGGLLGGLAAARLSQRQLFLTFGGHAGGHGRADGAALGPAQRDRGPRRRPGLLGGRLREGETTYVYRVQAAARRPCPRSLAAGALSGLLGLGGGIIKVPVLNTFCGIPIRVAAATSTFMIGVTAAASAFIYFSRGDVALHLTAAVCLGALPGSLLGAHLSERVHARSLKIMMAIVLLAVAARMALEGL